MFWHNAAETWVDVRSEPDSGLMSAVTSYLGGGQAQPSKHVHWISESGALDAFLMLGPTAADVMRQYKRLTGATQLPPVSGGRQTPGPQCDTASQPAGQGTGTVCGGAGTVRRGIDTV